MSDRNLVASKVQQGQSGIISRLDGPNNDQFEKPNSDDGLRRNNFLEGDQNSLTNQISLNETNSHRVHYSSSSSAISGSFASNNVIYGGFNNQKEQNNVYSNNATSQSPQDYNQNITSESNKPNNDESFWNAQKLPQSEDHDSQQNNTGISSTELYDKTTNNDEIITTTEKVSRISSGIFVFPNQDHHELQINNSYVPSYLDLNKECE